MAVTYEKLIIDYPEFERINEHAIARTIRHGCELLSKQAWGGMYTMALELWVCHHLALEFSLAEACAGQGQNNPLQMGTVIAQTASTSSLSVTTAAPKMQASEDPLTAHFARTRYGMQFLTLLHTAMPSAAIVCSADTSSSPWQ